MTSDTHACRRPREAAMPFQSFWMTGFEGADHVNLRGDTIDMSAVTGHALQFRADFARALALGLGTVRESVGWRVCAPRTHREVSFSRMLLAAQAAESCRVQVIWTLMHYGMPPDVRVTDRDFASRFAEFAGACARQLRGRTERAPIYNPINEIGFLAWALATRRIIGADCSERNGYLVKMRLVEAALRAVEAIRAEDDAARFIHIEPLIHVAAPPDQPTLALDALEFCTYQWQAWDMLLGREAPELGGDPSVIDWIGVNHYHDAQWEIGSGQALDWWSGDSRRRSFGSLLDDAWQRYRIPLVVAETGHFGAGRSRWLDEIATQTAAAMRQGVEVHGLCLYPAVDRPDWNDPAHWHRSGIWDAGDDGDLPSQPTARRLAEDYAGTLRQWQGRLGT